MSQVKGQVGKWELVWKTVPHGKSGTVQLEARHPELQPEPVLLEVHWRQDPHGLWLGLPHGFSGFDIDAQLDDDGRISYRVVQRNSDREWTSLHFVRPGEELSECVAIKKSLRVRAQMPGKIIRLLAEFGQVIEKDQPLLVMEAMKMENEIRALHAGKISKVAVVEGQAVETGADLLVIDPV